MTNSRARLTDRRLLIIFVLLITILAIGGTWVKRTLSDFEDFRRAALANCKANRDNTIAFNRFVTTSQQTTISSPLLKDSDKRLRVALYQEVKQRVPQCPPAPAGLQVHTDPPPPAPAFPSRKP